MERYNGFKNWETWLANVHLDDVSHPDELESFKDYWESEIETLDSYLLKDLLNDAFDKIDWEELRKNIQDLYEEE